jgi:hypothetical protein
MTDFSNEMHLGQDEIDEALIGCLADAASGHLDACAVCQQRVTAARLPIEDFKAVTMAWSERRSATMPTSLSTRLLESASRQRRLAWGAAVTTLLAVMIAAPLELQHYGSGRAGHDDSAELGTARAVGATGVVSGQQSTEEQIARDNQLLNEIDLELNSSNASSATLGLQTDHSSKVAHVEAVSEEQD